MCLRGHSLTAGAAIGTSQTADGAVTALVPAPEEAVTDAAFKERARSGGAPGAFFSDLSKINYA